MKGWIFTTQEKPSYETKKMIQCFEDVGIKCYYVHPNHVDIYISKEDRKGKGVALKLYNKEVDKVLKDKVGVKDRKALHALVKKDKK